MYRIRYSVLGTGYSKCSKFGTRYLVPDTVNVANSVLGTLILLSKRVPKRESLLLTMSVSTHVGFLRDVRLGDAVVHLGSARQSVPDLKKKKEKKLFRRLSRLL